MEILPKVKEKGDISITARLITLFVFVFEQANLVITRAEPAFELSDYFA